MICDALWLQINDLIFSGRRCSNLYAIHKASRLVHEACLKKKYFIDSASFVPHNVRAFILNTQLVHKHLIVISFSWKKPNEGWVKINVDGFVIGNPGVMSWGGIIRDCPGNLISGLARHLDVGTLLEARRSWIAYWIANVYCQQFYQSAD
ncbi:hypothetical protein ACH5RR_008897 [Cinchona calisaya]|uniref:RNase H type-1 domain-containing protein n=1 Tax=Cinchona calisaya TaxID=153742 RepID=A0ABD3AGL0_9GENT